MGKTAGKKVEASPKRALPVALAVCLLAVAGVAVLWKTKSQTSAKAVSPSATNAPGPLMEDERAIFAQYAGSASCRECHEEQFKQWTNSHHGLAERMLAAEPDRKAFDPALSFKHGTQHSELRWTSNSAQIATLGLSSNQELHEIIRVIGHTPVRQFLTPFPGGRFQTLEASYDPRSNQWFNVYADEDRKPGEWGHWTGRGMNWNYMCASCHNTRLRRNYDEASDVYHTAMAEMTVGCEACHGPMKAHNEWQRQYAKQGGKDPTLKKFTSSQVVDYCGYCHARRTDLTGDFKPGDNFADHCELALVDHTEVYYSDGQVRGENYEYGSFLGSRMAQKGVHCGDCHNPHSGKTLLPGNLLCLRCHNGSMTNAPAINPVTHSRHKVFGFDATGQGTNADLLPYRPAEIKEKGGECVNCHMPQTVYMQRHWRHDHGFTIPDPLLTKQFGIPNACNRCHQDKDADWALKYCNEWYGTKMERPTRQRAQVLARAQRGEPKVREELTDWLKKEESPYWQAAMLGFLAPWAGRPEISQLLIEKLEQTNALVRVAAARSLEPALFAPGVSNALYKRLFDPVRSVRVAAASGLRASVDSNSIAGRELLHYLDNNADQPGGQLQKGIYFYSRNEPDKALEHLKKAVGWDPYSAPIRHELAVLLSALNRPQDAVEALKEACRIAPRDAESHYKLGLAYNEMGQMQKTIEELSQVVALDPGHASAWYNLGLAKNSIGQSEAALEALARAEFAGPEEARVPYARATILARLGRTKDARVAARRTLELDPNYSDARELLQALPE